MTPPTARPGDPCARRDLKSCEAELRDRALAAPEKPRAELLAQAELVRSDRLAAANALIEVASHDLSSAREAGEDDEAAIEELEAATQLLFPNEPAMIVVQREVAAAKAARLVRHQKYVAERQAIDQHTPTCEPADAQRLLELDRLRRSVRESGELGTLAERWLQTCFDARHYDATLALFEAARQLESPKAPSEAALMAAAVAKARGGSFGAPTSPPNEELASTEPARAKPPHPKSEEAEPPQRPVEAPADPAIMTLRVAEELFARGDHVGAFRRLETARATAKSAEAKALVEARRRQWEPERRKIVAGLIERAERELSSEHPDQADALYAEVLEIDPDNAVAKDRRAKIQRLRELRGASHR